jgi:hypothetical protein
MSWIAVSEPAETRKLPKLSSVPAGMTAGLIVMVRGCFCSVTTCEKPGDRRLVLGEFARFRPRLPRPVHARRCPARPRGQAAIPPAAGVTGGPEEEPGA